ncbi:DUF4861 domain-containing protein [Pontibacter akesuensis]|uniref:DUF4861 domain-containing protein n=1 Tax=Pontibacter akesuensis TaxID=388950 RepID=A0A1I7K5P9_9BACT|nr:DUF4861 domain-containing protein [Pontibacter akesuensis]GHA74882.1 hypothetical protein GCM10007389_30830 [Pontibacter akesuensis]SFU92741.1 protein of unknown function [Pontibacter akesuensis]
MNNRLIESLTYWIPLQLLLVVLFAQDAHAQNLKQEFPRALSMEVKNPLSQPRQNVMVFIAEADLKKSAPDFNPNAFVVLNGKTEIPSQYNSKLKEKKGIMLVLDELKANEARKLTIRYNKQGIAKRDYTKRTQAELSHKVGGKFKNRKYIGGTFQNVDSLRVPDEVTDHSYYIRYEGPGWESDKVGYRFYLDWRNGTDVFGKKTNEMVLQQVGQDGYDSYHEEGAWGMDVLKVGKSLGVGTLAHFHNGQANRIAETDSMISVIRENGNLYSSIGTNYYGWKVADMEMGVQSQLGIHAGSRLTHHQVQVTGANPENLSTGLIKDAKAKLLSSTGSDKAWGYLATYGQQSLNNDKLGIAVLFRPKDFIRFTEDANSHVVQLKPEANQLEYYFLAAWELEPEGIKNEAQFTEYLNKTAAELANPVQVRLSKR